MPDAFLSLRGLDAHHGDFHVLFGVDMEEFQGEAVAIIGANCAGKITLMRSISGLVRNRPDQVWYLGREIGALRADQVARLGIALVPERRQLFPFLSVEDNLLLGARFGRAGPWMLDTVYELFPVLRDRRKWHPHPCPGASSRWPQSAGP